MTQVGRPPWDFDYRPIAVPSPGMAGPGDAVVATATRLPIEAALAVLRAEVAALAVEEILCRAPLFWLRVRAPAALDPGRLTAALGGLAKVRYVASALHGSQQWAPPFVATRAAAASASDWTARGATSAPERRDGGHWFLADEGGGIAARRAITGTGAGTRLAVIDDDAAGADELDLDAEVLVGPAQAPRAQSHGALMVGWAAAAARVVPPFRGVAPDASPRLYLIAKPGTDVVSLPLAIVRAVSDGADVVVCATYLEGSWSAMLDDALAFAERLGRRGRGTVVVLPTGRETSSPPGSVHASLSLSLGDPASDPRVLCVAPGARNGGWFFYRDRKKRARPFANRGPAVRFLAPGDDVAYPLGDASVLHHAESSGAAAVAAGVALLVLAKNPSLRLREVFAILESTLTDVAPAVDPAWAPFADPHDTLPPGQDRDRHNAKHGYGALEALRACCAAADPVAWALERIGEVAAASAFVALRRSDPAVRAAYSPRLARWVVRALVADARASHAARVLVRHLRLLAAAPKRRADGPEGALAKQLALLLRGLTEGTAVGRPPPLVRRELDARLARLAAAPGPLEAAWCRLAERVFGGETT